MANQDGLSFCRVPDRLAALDDFRGAKAKITVAMIRACGVGASLSLARRDIKKLTGYSVGQITATISWLKEIGELVFEDDPDARSGRRMVFTWLAEKVAERQGKGAPTPCAPARTPLRAGAHPPPRRRAPSSAQARMPFIEEEIKREEERENVPSPTPSRAAAALAIDAPRGTGRDALSGSGEGEERPPEPTAAPTPNGRTPEMPHDARVAYEVGRMEELLSTLRGTPDRPSEARTKLLARIELVKAGDFSASLPPEDASPPAPRPVPAACYASRSAPADADGNVRRSPPRLEPDPSAPIAEALDRVKAAPSEADKFAAADHFSRVAAARWRDDNPESLETFEDAALYLPHWKLSRLVTQSEGPGVRLPAHYFSTRAAAELKSLRQRSRASPAENN